jgi:drug/metabolite transporter (DMT)-like permease
MVLLSQASVRGIFWKFFSTFCFAVVTVLSVHLLRSEEKIPPFELAFLETFLAFFFLLFLKKSDRVQSFKTFFFTKKPYYALPRALCACVGFVLWFDALRLLPLGILAFFRLLGPFCTFAGALLLLREKTSPLQIMASLGALCGAGFLLQQEILGGVWFLEEKKILILFMPLGAILAFSGSNILGKKLLKTTSPSEATLSLLAISSVFLGVITLPVWCYPTLFQWSVLLIVGFFDALAQWSLSKALSLTKLSLLVPISLWRFGLMAVSGFFFFGEPFSPSLWIGVVLLSLMTGLLIWSKEKQEVRKFSHS